jgi:hypothetical protein
MRERPTSGSGKKGWKHLIGKEGDWDSLGLPHAIDLPVSGERPIRIAREAALEKLATPYLKHDPLGYTIGFGERLREHLKSHGHEARAEFLPHMEAAIEHPSEIWSENTDQGPRIRHIAVFQGSDGKRSFAVVSHQKGETRTEIITGTPKSHSGINNARKGRLLYLSY